MIKKNLRMKKMSKSLILLISFSFLLYPQDRTKKETVIASQITEEQLKILSTDELLEKCLGYPYIVDVMFAQNIPLMFKYIRQEFNGFNELFERQDAAQVILNRFLNFNFQKVNEYQESYQRGLYVFKFCYLNLLLAQEEIINKLANNYGVIKQINKKYSEANDESVSSFRSVVPITFVAYNMFKYLENTDLGKSSEMLPIVSLAQSMRITSVDYSTFENLTEFIMSKIEGK